jgi:type I restriction enzyme R subunit
MRDLAHEREAVELPLIEQLKSMGWQHIEGQTGVPYLTERQSFREVLLTGRLRDAIRRVNLDENGQPWLDERRVTEAASALERLGAHRLMEANQAATTLLLTGTSVEGDPARHGGRDQTAHFIDFAHPERNDFLAINQFRVDLPGGQSYIIPDMVLFVNGIPLVVIECKSPLTTNPMEEGITQLLRYSNQRAWVEEQEGVERLFHYNQLLISTCFHEARVGTVGASFEQYLEWKDTSPVPQREVAAALGVEKLSSQQLLVAGMLRPAHLLDLLHNFTLFQQSGGSIVKIVARYQQFRAVQEAIRRLEHGQTRAQHGDTDQRGGVIWHTQGSGKSLTMVFLVRKLRTLPALRAFKVVVITDRTTLEKQLSDTAALTGETVRKARTTDALQPILREPGADLVFAMIQKYQERDDEPASGPEQEPLFPILNESEQILVLVDEAHRSQASKLHANLLRALPNCARIGFTGTPILLGERKLTQDIFGPFLDIYTIQQSEADGATVPILYEGRTVNAEVADGRRLDEAVLAAFPDSSPRRLAEIAARYVTSSAALEAEQLIAAKAEDMLRHYIGAVLPNGFKAQVVASSRLAATRYQAALAAAHRSLLERLESLDPALLALEQEALESRDDAETQFLVRAHAHLEAIRRLEFAAIISGSHNDPPSWRAWSEAGRVDALIERFKKPLAQDGLAFLCVKSMLLTGFDAPVEQALYLDRSMQGHELLQAIARVNRTSSNKTCGLVVDYFGVTDHLTEALAVYSQEDVQGALFSLKDQLPVLEARYQRVLALFRERGLSDLGDSAACVDVLREVKLRAEFVVRFKQFMQSLDQMLPRPEALHYLRDARRLGLINQLAANLYRDNQLNLLGAGQKVRQLIDQYVLSRGIDPRVPPISILDANFAQAVDAHPSPRAKASEMEHAARHYISQHLQEDPVYYQRLSQRLEAILQAFQERWEALVAALQALTEEIRAGRPADQTGLDPRTQAPFLSILVEETGAAGEPTPEQLSRLAKLTIALVDHIRQQIRMVDFWRTPHLQGELRGWIMQYLDQQDVVPFERQAALADRIMELAKALHARLTA